MTKLITQQNSQHKNRRHQYKADYKMPELYKHYKEKYGKNALPLAKYSAVIKTFNKRIVDELFDNYEFTLPFFQ